MDQVQLETKRKFSFPVKTIEYIIPIVHILLTFWLERFVFIFKDNWKFANEIARTDVVSDTAELVIVYVLSKICAGIIIWMFWKMVFGIIKGRIPKQVAILFGAIYLVGLLIGVFYYPGMFNLAIDNYTTYAMAIRFLPSYWQSIFTGAWYAGCMMVFPHPFGIFVYQWMALVAVVAYLYCKVDQWLDGSKLKYCVLLLLALPETYYLMFDAYRNNYYAMLCVFYFGYLFFATKKVEKKSTFVEMLLIMLVSAFLMVWRSEGILIGVVGVAYLFLFVYKVNWKKIVALLAVFGCSFILLSNLQDIGSKKYYGEDYMIVNTTEVLRGIFNNPNANFDYEGAEEDIEAIEAIVPIQVLKEAGLDGFRNYNWTMGRLDFNQTLADDETASAYMSAYYRIILNNMTDYLNVQANSFFASLQINALHPVYSYQGGIQTDLEGFDYYRWKIGQYELQETYLTEDWMENEFRLFMNSVFTWIMQVWRELWVNTGISAQLHALVLFADIMILCVELILLCTEKEKAKHVRNVMLFTILLGEFAAVVLFMPVGRAAYMYPMLYSSYLLIFLYIVDYFKSKKENGNIPQKVEQVNEK